MLERYLSIMMIFRFLGHALSGQMTPPIGWKLRTLLRERPIGTIQRHRKPALKSQVRPLQHSPPARPALPALPAVKALGKGQRSAVWGVCWIHTRISTRDFLCISQQAGINSKRLLASMISSGRYIESLFFRALDRAVMMKSPR